MMREPKSYEAKVKEFVTRYASNNGDHEAGEEGETDGEMSSVEDFDSDGDEDEPAGAMEDV